MSNHRERTNLMIAATSGTVMEWYDFFIFGTCSVLVFNKVFYPGDDAFVSTLLSLGTFAVGFLARPLGGIVFGALGDRIGRKKMLVVSLLFMGFSTIFIGLLPTYSQIGAAAPVLLILFRIMQGVAVGGESTGALTMIAESMPADRRGFWTSFTMLAGPGANVLAAGAVGLVISHIGEAQFVAWGWRIPFLLSVILVVIGFFARRRIEESPLFLAIADRRKQLSQAPLREAFDAYRTPMLRVFLVKASENTFLYLFSTFLLLLATGYLKFSRGDALNALIIGSVFEVFVILAAARISDSVGRRPVLLVGLFGAILAGFGLFTLSPGTSYLSLLTVVMVCLTFHGLIGGAMAAFFVEQFPTRVRYTAMSASYQLASVAGGSIAPLVGALLLERFGTPQAVAVYATAVAVPAIAILLLSRETKGIDLSDERLMAGASQVPRRGDSGSVLNEV